MRPSKRAAWRCSRACRPRRSRRPRSRLPPKRRCRCRRCFPSRHLRRRRRCFPSRPPTTCRRPRSHLCRSGRQTVRLHASTPRETLARALRLGAPRTTIYHRARPAVRSVVTIRSAVRVLTCGQQNHGRNSPDLMASSAKRDTSVDVPHRPIAKARARFFCATCRDLGSVQRVRDSATGGHDLQPGGDIPCPDCTRDESAEALERASFR